MPIGPSAQLSILLSPVRSWQTSVLSIRPSSKADGGDIGGGAVPCHQTHSSHVPY